MREGDETEELKVPEFLDDDPEEAQAYRKVECLRLTLQNQLASENSGSNPSDIMT